MPAHIDVSAWDSAVWGTEVLRRRGSLCSSGCLDSMGHVTSIATAPMATNTEGLRVFIEIVPVAMSRIQSRWTDYTDFEID